MAEAAGEEQEQPAATIIHKVDTENCDYVLDLYTLAQISPRDPANCGFITFRIYALPRGFSREVPGMHGTYFINEGEAAKGKMDGVTLPAIIKYKDAAIEQKLALLAKSQDGKVHVGCIELPLLVSTEQKGRKTVNTYRPDMMLSYTSLDVIESFLAFDQDTENFFSPFCKQSRTFAKLNLRALVEIRAWCEPKADYFAKQLAIVVENCRRTIIATTQEDAGLNPSVGAKRGGRSKEARAAAAAETVAEDARLDVLRQVEASLRELAPYLEQPYQARLLIVKMPVRRPAGDNTYDIEDVRAQFEFRAIRIRIAIRIY